MCVKAADGSLPALERHYSTRLQIVLSVTAATLVARRRKSCSTFIPYKASGGGRSTELPTCWFADGAELGRAAALLGRFMTLANRVRALFFLTHLQGTPATKNEVLSFLLVFAPAAAAAADYMAGLVDETYAAVAFDVRERCRTRRERVCRCRRVWRHVMWPAPSAAPWSARPLAATLWTTCAVVVDGGEMAAPGLFSVQ